MKNGIKIGLAFLIGVLVSGVTVYAATTYLSKDVIFTPSNSEWKVSNVEEALNSLYESKDFNFVSKIGKHVNSGTSASVDGFVVGERYFCTVNMRKEVKEYNISGAEILYADFFGSMLDYQYMTFHTYLEASTESITFEFNGAEGFSIRCYTLE